LILAAEKGNLEMTKMLLKRGADLLASYNNPRNVSVGGKAFIKAVQEGHKDIVESLLQADNCFVKKVDEQYQTPLYWAVDKGNWSTASVLIRHGGTLFGSSTDLDPGLPKNVSLINGQPSSVRFWGRDGMPVDFSQ
jgi:ankyrin repeat protein